MARSLPTGSPLLLAPPRKAFSFTDYARLAPMQSLPGDRLDTELESIRASLSAVVEVLRGVVAGEIPIAEVDLTNVVAFNAPAQFGDGPNGIPINPADQIGTRILTQRTGSVSGYPQQDVLLTQPVYDMTPAAQDALNSANAARDAAIIARNQAASSQTAAASSAGAASTSAGAASTSEANALASKNAASTSASGAAGSATTAGNYSNTGQLTLNKTYTAEHYAWSFAEELSGPVMTEAEYAALDPALKPPGYTYNPVAGMPAGLWSAKWWAVQAQTFSGDADDSAAAANAAAAAANAAAANANAAAESFGDLYLGPFAAGPTVDNDGDPLQEGALYYSTTADMMHVWDGATWVAFTTASGTGTSAALVSFSPTGGISGTNVQAGMAELDAEKLGYEPQDGGTYGRKSGAWVSVLTPTIDWSSITGKPSTFPPSAHTHPQSEVTGLVAALAAKAPQTSLDTTNANLATETGLRVSNDDALQTNINTEVTNRTNADTTLQTNINAKIGDAPSNGKIYTRKDASWVEAAPSGASPSPAPPVSPQVGQFWWESDTGNLFVYFDDGNTSQWVQANYTPPAPDLSGYLQKTGGTLTGPLVLAADPVVPLGSATKQFAEAKAAAAQSAAQTYTDNATANATRPACVANRVGGGNVALGVVYTKVPVTALGTNIGGFALTGGSIVVPKAGTYRVDASIGILTPATTAFLEVGASLNAATSPFMRYRVNNPYNVAAVFVGNVSRLVTLAAGDSISLMALYAVTGGNAVDTVTDTALCLTFVSP